MDVSELPMTQSPPTETGDTPNVWARSSALLLAWRDGDSGAFDALVRLLTPILWQVVRAYGLQRATAEDVIQDVWLTLARDPGQIKDPTCVGGWLLTTARRRAWKAAGSKQELLGADLSVKAEATGHTESAENTALAGLFASDLWAAVASLEPRCRRLLRILAFDDRPNYAGISAELAMPIGSIGPTRRRCLDRLRTHLAQGGLA